jgi:hypothetical protein
MNAKHLTNYLKDHFAGSVAAVELLDHLISSNRGQIHEQFLIQLRQEVGEDQDVLSGLLRDLHADPWRGAQHDSLLEREVGANQAVAGRPFRRPVGRSLLAVAEIPALQKVDFAKLDQRAEDQRKRVEDHRIEAAREAFVPVGSGS